MAATPDGLGYWEVSTTGRVFSFGDATPAGDIPSLGLHLNGFIVGITPDPVTGGYWLVGSDGGIFSFGAPFFGSTGAIRLNQPVVAMQSTSDGQGYWFVAIRRRGLQLRRCAVPRLHGRAASQPAHGRAWTGSDTGAPIALRHGRPPDAAPRVTAHAPAT